jgi:hypothetical protein
MKSMTKAVLLALLALVLSLGCTKAGIQYQDVYKDGRNFLKIAHETDKHGNIVPQGYNHPQVFTEEQLRSILGHLEFQEYSFFKWRKPKALFVEKELVKLAPALVDAFATIGPDEWIEFSSSTYKRDYLWPTPRFTDGRMWFENGALQIALANLNRENVEWEERNRSDARRYSSIESFRIVTGPYVAYPAVNTGDPLRKAAHTNWVLIDTTNLLPALASAPTKDEQEEADRQSESVLTGHEQSTTESVAQPAGQTAPPAAAAPPATDAKSVKERLQALQELLDAGLITKDEYERKKAEILQAL